jgi:hypothetical protein
MDDRYVLAVVEANERGGILPIRCFGVGNVNRGFVVEPHHSTLGVQEFPDRRSVLIRISKNMSVAIVSDSVTHTPARPYNAAESTPEVYSDDVLCDLVHAAMGFAWPKEYYKHCRDAEKAANPGPITGVDMWERRSK